MAKTREDVLQRFEELSVLFEVHNHDAVMTVEEQEKGLSNVEGALTKNLFLKDKRGRLYIITALTETAINLKVLAARLGVGKGGVRMAPEELVPTVLQIPAGSVTPLAVCQPGAEHVVLLLDQKLKTQKGFMVHPLTNTSTVVLTPAGLEAFLRSVQREAIYVDLEADPPITKDSPPDLKIYADAVDVARPEGGSAPPPAAAGAKASAEASGSAQSKEAQVAAQSRADDVMAATSTIADQAAAVLGRPPSDALGSEGWRRAQADIEMHLNGLRNREYTRGFQQLKQGATVADSAGSSGSTDISPVVAAIVNQVCQAANSQASEAFWAEVTAVVTSLKDTAFQRGSRAAQGAMHIYIAGVLSTGAQLVA